MTFPFGALLNRDTLKQFMADFSYIADSLLHRKEFKLMQEIELQNRKTGRRNLNYLLSFRYPLTLVAIFT